MSNDLKACKEGLHNVRQLIGAASTQSRPPAIVVPLPTQFTNDSTTIRTRTPTRASTIYEEIELSTYLRPESAKLGSMPSTPLSSVFARRGSNGSVSLKVAEEPEGSIFPNTTYRTDIITFCSHVRLNPALESARITHVQARKSQRLPFLHEYLLVYFATSDSQRFVARIDRLGKVGSSSTSEDERSRGVASNTAIQEIGVYHIQDPQSGVDSADTPWLARDGTWGSKPVVTLVTREAHMHISHHLKTAPENSSQHPTLGDVSRLLEGVLLEMPAYHLTTANCYLMTRSSLLLLQRCYPHAFECYLGGTSSEPIDSSSLAEPVWTGLVRWYLPFAALFMSVYLFLLVTTYYLMSAQFTFSTHTRVAYGARYALHYGFDVPLPLGFIHAYMNSLETSANTIVVNLSAQFLIMRDGNPSPIAQTPPFTVMFDNPWMALAIWWMVGSVIAFFVFVIITVEYGGFVVFVFMLILCVWFNLKYGDSGVGMGLDEEAETAGLSLFDPPTSTES
ncbi:unnamed protein product [Rhizoctonia solani]|uniref:Uncharacterized protein n=1 Tax=Rhizoctonia solani TaxID=456999 RepID=A0A8H3DQH0_9AGAM|nr:unnamed protein product [Rhizoctonia solani]